MTATIFKSIQALDNAFLKAINPDANPYFERAFLEGFEQSNPQIDFRYIRLSDKNGPKALAVVQMVHLSVDVILKNISISHGVRRFLNLFFCQDHIKIMFCGNVFLSGNYGLSFAKNSDKKLVIKHLAKTLQNLSKTHRPLHAIFIKDFVLSDLVYTNGLRGSGFTDICVEPNMIIKLKEDWTSFDDFKSALKSKYRIKANKADTNSTKMDSRELTENELQTYKKDLQELYQNTIDNATFNAQVLNLKTYIYLKQKYRERFIVKGYFLDQKLVGFLSAFHHHNKLDAHFIGLNYTLNKSHSIYPRILNDYVRLGIEKQVDEINLGRTASEIKSTIGATPSQLTCYIKHRHRTINLLVRPFFRRIKIKNYKQHAPFK